jgi:hypothetical protein
MALPKNTRYPRPGHKRFFGNRDTVQVGESVYVGGNPKGLEGTFSQGIVSGIRGGKSHRQASLFCARINPLLRSGGGAMLTFREIGDFVVVNLKVEYPDQDFLPIEVAGVLKGFLISLRWSVLRSAQSKKETDPYSAIDELITQDRFATEWVTRAELVDRISYTSGLDGAMSEITLRVIEGVVQRQIEETGTAELESVGTIQAEGAGYRIALSTILKAPPARRRPQSLAMGAI